MKPMKPLNTRNAVSPLVFFRHILQKYSSIHKVLPAFFALSDKKILQRYTHAEYSEVPL